MRKPKASLTTGKPTDTPLDVRRQGLLEQLAQEFPLGFFHPEESISILFAPLDIAKRAITAARIRLLMRKEVSYSLDRPFNQRPVSVLRPTHVLSKLNRGRTFPPVVPQSLPKTLQSLTDTLDQLREENARSVPPHLLLDQLATTLKLDWSVAAALLLSIKIITRPFDENDLVIVREARQFWIRYSEARAQFVAFLQFSTVNSLQGDWGLVSREQLLNLLPGLILPDHCERRSFLTNYVHNVPCLDLHSTTSLPLARHPFPAEYNPLVFGRPRRLALN